VNFIPHNAAPLLAAIQCSVSDTNRSLGFKLRTKRIQTIRTLSAKSVEQAELRFHGFSR
jgi:hypothetical protein